MRRSRSSGDTVVVGTDADSVGADARQGSAYVFVRSATMWSQQAQLTAADGAADDLFGSRWDSGDTVVVGAPNDTVNLSLSRRRRSWSARGSAYVFARSGATWSPQAQLVGANGGAENYFGWSVAIWEAPLWSAPSGKLSRPATTAGATTKARPTLLRAAATPGASRRS